MFLKNIKNFRTYFLQNKNLVNKKTRQRGRVFNF